jgi:hypothetical protein
MLERASWAYGLVLIVVTIVIHTTAVVLIALASLRVRVRIDRQEHRPSRVIAFLISHIAAIGLMLTALHGLESALWAAVYVRVGAIGSFSNALLLSLAAMTTRGTPALALPYEWQMMGALEGLNGIILFGITTAFIFAVLHFYWSKLSARQQESTLAL